MSWFGEQITSITGKLSDFTKEVLIESSGLLSPEGDAQNASVPQEYTEHSPETLLQLLQEKDSQIEQLTEEKELCDKNIETLDEQHQEEVHQLLLQRSRLVEENLELKEKLKTLEASCRHIPKKGSSPTTDSISGPDVQDTIKDNLHNEHEDFSFGHVTTDLDHDYDNINLFSVLCSLRNCSDSKLIEEAVLCLENKRCCLSRLLEKGQSDEITEYIQKTIENINCYISYLKLALNHSEVFLPVIRENGTILHLLHSRSVSLEENINSLTSEVSQLNDEIRNLNEKNSEKDVDSAAQVANAIDLILENTIDVAVGTVSSVVESRHSQTDGSLELGICENCIVNEETINTLQCNTENYIQQIHLLQQEVEFTNNQLQSRCSSTSVETQTSDICKCDLLKSELSEQKIKFEKLQTVVNEKENDFTLQLQKELSQYSELLDAFKNQENLIEAKEKTINDKNCEICILEAQVNELEEHVNIINQEQSKYSSTSVETQTSDDCKCDFLKSKLSEQNIKFEKLKTAIDEKENNFTVQLQKELSRYSELLNAFKEQEKFTEAKEKTINDKNCEISALKSKVSELEEHVKIINQEQSKYSSTSVETQTNKACQCDFLKYELNEQKIKFETLKTTVDEKENNFTVQLQKELSQYTELLNAFKEQEKLIEAKEKTINDKKCEISMLRSKLSEFKEGVNIINQKQSGKSLSYNEKVDITCKTLLKTECYPEKSMLSDCSISMMGKTSEVSYMEKLANEDIKFHEQLKKAELEKERILCVLNEKTQECSSLKAEVHRLTAIVASEKQALLKLQQDNHELKRRQQDSLDPELTKEALQNLSRLIRDKDIEVEALKQKNESLSSLLQQPSSFSTEHLQSVMEECENLTKQLNICKAEQERYMRTCNSKEQECQKYLAEVQRLTSLLSCESEKFDVLQQQHNSVAQQYEEKRKSLINTQNEMIALKQRVTDLEQQQVEIKEKYSELLNKINSDVLIQVHRDEYNSKLSEIESLRTSSKEKDDLIHEKDCIIHELSQQIKKQKAALEDQEQAYVDQRRENSDLLVKLNDAKNSSQKLQEEKESLNQRLNDKHAELGLQKEMNERLNMTINEKEFCIQSMGKKITSLSQIIQGNVSSSAESPYNCDIDQILAESDLMYTKAEHFQRERDESLLSLSQSQHENQELKNEIQKFRSTEEHLKSELDRLRQHLLQIEENYTSEALRAEEREKELRNQLAELENRTRTKCSAVTDASHEANIQISSLQEQLSMIANQRDRALSQVSALDDKVQQYVASLNNLQLVLEQMEKGHKQKVADVEKKLLSKLEKEKEHCRKLDQELEMKQMHLTESSQALEAASRLSEQLDSKEEVIAILRCELQKAENKVRNASDQIESIKSNTEGKVDRVVIKSLVLGYFSTPSGQKSEVVRLLARVLDFNQEEMEKAGIIVSRSQRGMEQKGLFSSLFGRLPSLVHTTQPRNVSQPPQPEKSFTSLFVQFLENESQPINPIPLPAEKMANEVTSKKNHSSKTQQLTNAPLLLNLATAFPTFTPIPVSDSGSPAPSILKEVLK